MKVYIVFENVDYEGSNVCSVHGTRESADAEAKRLNDGNTETSFWYGVSEYEVQS